MGKRETSTARPANAPAKAGIGSISLARCSGGHGLMREKKLVAIGGDLLGESRHSYTTQECSQDSVSKLARECEDTISVILRDI
jgi:hypothetical protein